MQYQIIRISTCAKMLGLSRATIWRRLRDDETFPRLVKLGNSEKSAVGFFQNEVESWIEKSAQLRKINIDPGEKK